MGTDFRGFVEYKLDSWYVFAGDIDFPRNYRLFSCLGSGGFTGKYQYIKSKGLPKDTSFAIRCEHTYDKAGRGSWLSLSEIHQAHMEYMSHGHDPVPAMSVLTVMMEELSKSYECRFVFWFNI